MPTTSSRFLAATVVVIVAVTFANQSRHEAAISGELATQQRTVAELQKRLDSAQTDWSAIAAIAEPSVVTIEAGDSLGSGWVVHADSSNAEIVTNFHVVAETWSGGTASVQVRQGDHTWPGTIEQVDRSDDLAVIHIAQHMQALIPAAQRPKLGTTVMAVGSPLGLDGTISIGVVSGYRSLGGSNYLQFTAAISPGNSGGPVIDSRGRVVAIASAKLVYPGAEALSLGIPVQVACDSFVVCKTN